MSFLIFEFRPVGKVAVWPAPTHLPSDMEVWVVIAPPDRAILPKESIAASREGKGNGGEEARKKMKIHTISRRKSVKTRQK